MGTPLLWLSLLLAMTLLLAVGVGGIGISPVETLAVIGNALGLPFGDVATGREADVLLAIRLPRVLLGLLVGGTLGVSGGAMQGLFRNPLADPGLIGISAGGGLAAVAAIVGGTALFGSMEGTLQLSFISFSAFLGSLIAALFAYRVGAVNGQLSVATLVLAGVAVNALAGAGTGFLTYIATDVQLRSITFWGLGSLGNGTWTNVGVLLPFALAAIVGLPFMARQLNALALGEAEAGYLGVNVGRLKLGVILLSALGVGASVAMTGVIGFIGLVVPHLIRLTLGPDHRLLLPGSALLGAVVVVGADALCRTVAAPAELPIGIVTAGIGAPFFLWLLLRRRREIGGELW